MNVDEKNDAYSAVSVIIALTPEMNRLLTLSAERSGRSKASEARLRLTDHLCNFSEIACSGKRFSNDA